MELAIRLATGADSAALLALLKTLQSESDTFCIAQDVETIDVVSESDNIEALQNTLNNVMLVVADDADNLYGIATATASLTEPTHAEVGIAVLKDYQGYGLAQALLDELINWGETYSSNDQLWLTVQKRNTVARHIYEKFGFVYIPKQAQGVDQTTTPETEDMVYQLKGGRE
ncbi:GNAT family N-acetyltransferase [Weissella minor]|uniref:GNAT family N-acetyltransferase n=1 Tax=Weissella minor TaxID=1620 RepID=UPI001BAFDFCD|nr:GNAT family N-acetyltransferase [Weissella minor]MBS0950301.1 GNAT family N-acetyltransferase [Weissella minor]